MKAVWNDHIIAESDDTLSIEGNHYFPPQSLRRQYFTDGAAQSLCYWKGMASYYDVSAGSQRSVGAAWYYPTPTRLSKKIVGKDFSGYVAFWKDIKVIF